MRFFTTLQKAGRLEYFLVSIVLFAAYIALGVYVLEVGAPDLAVSNDPSELGEMRDQVTYKAGAFPIFLIGAVILGYFGIINVLRRLKDLNFGGAWALLLFVPLVGLVFHLYLLFSAGIDDRTYTPYGDDPYDPQSWVPPSAPNSGPAVTYQGQDLYLPGEQQFVQGERPVEGEQAA